MIELRHVARSFATQPVLEDVSLRVGPGEAVVIEGPSGCGKTTLLRVMAGLTAPERGERIARTERIGLAFQDDRSIPWLSVRQNLAFVTGDDPDAMAATEAGMARMGLTEAADKRPSELSGGMRKRLNILRALIVRPELLLLDEPYAYQDAQYCACINDDIRAALQRGAAAIVVSHEKYHAAPTGARMIRIDRAPVRLSGE